jgi:hypothetical protein
MSPERSPLVLLPSGPDTVREFSSHRTQFSSWAQNALKQDGGESGIRTHEPLAGLLAFEASSFDHSDISPRVFYFLFRIPRKKSFSIIPHSSDKIPVLMFGL